MSQLKGTQMLKQRFTILRSRSLLGGLLTFRIFAIRLSVKGSSPGVKKKYYCFYKIVQARWCFPPKPCSHFCLLEGAGAWSINTAKKKFDILCSHFSCSISLQNCADLTFFGPLGPSPCSCRPIRFSSSGEIHEI